MKKRIFTVLLAAAMTVSLAACAGTAENNAGKKTEETSAGQSVSKEAAESEAASKETPGENTPEQAASDEKASGGNAPEQSVVKWNCGTSGNVLLTLQRKRDI